MLTGSQSLNVTSLSIEFETFKCPSHVKFVIIISLRKPTHGRAKLECLQFLFFSIFHYLELKKHSYSTELLSVVKKILSA